jgi:hypothetical protein
MARGEEEEVSIFNMSFLDVFCCTVGALIFLLLILVLITKDMVEKKDLEDVQKSLAEARHDLQETEKARDKMQEEFASIRGKVDVARHEIRARDRRIEQLVSQLRDPGEASPESLLSDLPASALLSGDRSGRQRESQKPSQGKFLLGNLETRSIVCTSDGLYLGRSRKPLLRHYQDLDRVFRQFLRYHDAAQEGLWRTSWGQATASYKLSLELERDQKAYTGQGLVVHKEAAWPEAAAGTARVDVDQDGDQVKETRFEDTDGDGTLDVKRVNTDRDPFFEETYMSYDGALNQWRQVLVDTDGDDEYDLLLKDRDPSDGDYETRYVMPNLDTGNAVEQYEDRDNDGVWDIKFENTDLSNDTWERTYAMFDANHQRWGALLLDTNEDGNPDVLWRDTNMQNDDWEEKLVDTDNDGKWDVRWQDLDPRDSDWEAKFTEPKGTDDIWLRCEADSDADGEFDTLLVDRDGDGSWDEESAWDKAAGDWARK